MPARLAAALLLGLALTAHATAPKKTRADGVASTRTQLSFPLPGHERALRDNFHEKRGVRSHQALDIMAPRGTPVHAVDDGTVAKLYRGPMAGIAVYQFDALQSRVYMYAHLDRQAPGLVEGQPIQRGQIIGFVGSTGNAPESAPHLHFAMHELGEDKRWWKGKAANPYALLRGALPAREIQAANGP
jgi:murein DD-endopeptidase MepM/ murein hydrolase activator NlpD